MLAYLVRLFIFVVVTFTTLSTSAEWMCDFFTGVARDTKRRNCWPAPFACPDRQTVRAPFTIMVSNGWRKQNMLGDFHFEPATGQLTEAGKLKICWIMYEAPEQHRAIYVHIGKTTEETEARLAAVNAQAASLAPQSEMPPILSTTISDVGAPAERVDIIKRMDQSSRPVPRIPFLTSQDGGSTSGSTGP